MSQKDGRAQRFKNSLEMQEKFFLTCLQIIQLLLHVGYVHVKILFADLPEHQKRWNIFFSYHARESQRCTL